MMESDKNEMSAYLFVDTFAFEKLALQPECLIGQRGATMAGYETYLIEQWACERKVNTVVASYTGNSHHEIEVQVLLVPKDLRKWSPATYNHFEQLVRMHILPKETKLGNMLVTSLSSLPSNLSLVNMPKIYREGFASFAVNENLRRLNVVGRLAVTAEPPSESALATFRRSFAIHASVNSEYAVLEIVTLMQIALFYFGLLSPSYVDGLLCDFTIKAIETWWSSIGKTRFRVPLPRPSDKLYIRTSCAALIGVVIGARQRLSTLGLKPPKDPFDAENFVVCIKNFQKMVKLPKTNHFDSVTYFKLVRETTKANPLSGSKMLTKMKSTVKEGLSGKAMEALDDWETTDIELLAQNVRGERCKYLWQGKGSTVTPQLRSSLSASNVGALTKIPLFSLSNVDVVDVARPVSSPHSLLTPPLGTPSNYVPKGDNSVLGVAPLNAVSSGSSLSHDAFSSNGDSGTEIVQIPDTNLSVQRSNESQRSIVSRLRLRKQRSQKQFEESVPEFSTESYNDVTNSDHWFANAALFNTARCFDSSLFRALQNDLPETKKSPDSYTSIPEKKSPLDICALKYLTRDDSQIHHQSFHGETLRKSSSFSELECNILSWDGLISIPKLIMMYDRTQTLQNLVTNQMKESQKLLDGLENQFKKCESELSISQRNNVVLDYQFTASSKKEEAVKRLMRELEALMARLDYDLAMLTVKVKDVDQSVLTFSTKVDSVYSKWMCLKKVNNRSWWSRLFTRAN